MAITGDEFFGAPFASCGIVIISVNAKPSVAGAWILDGRVHLLHVDLTWSLVADVDGTGYIFGVVLVGPGAIFECEGGTSFGAAHAGDPVPPVDPTGHVVAGDAMKRVRCLTVDVAHADASAVSLSHAIDEKGGEKSVSINDRSGCYCQQYTVEVVETHVVDASLL